MKLDKLVLIIVVVLGAMILSFWLASLVLAALAVPMAWLAVLPAVLVGYIAWRVVEDRLTNAEDDHYDRIEK
ncbi:MAG TPA: hypothetical protein DIU07_05770 [Rhodobacteraceae bacterium]|nr:hypothetical protein [Paracoccaceae bacterium]